MQRELATASRLPCGRAGQGRQVIQASGQRSLVTGHWACSGAREGEGLAACDGAHKGS
jgi:hypothetical protein